MNEGQPTVRLEDGDELAAKLLDIGNQLKPIDDELVEALPHITPDDAKAWFRLALGGLQ
jgi:hypothetical protein